MNVACRVFVFQDMFHIYNSYHIRHSFYLTIQATKFPAEVVQSSMEVLLGCLPLRLKWEPVSQFLKLGGPTLLLQLVAMSADWGTYTGK